MPAIRRCTLVAGSLIAAVLAPVGAPALAAEQRAPAARSAAVLTPGTASAAARRMWATARAEPALGTVRVATPLPVIYSFPVGGVIGTATPDAAPPGANDWSCRPSAAHPRPVVLVHGTFENMIINWNALSPLLFNNGYCVFALNYGSKAGLPIKGLGPVAASAVQLRAFVDRVLAATGVSHVDIVGHSQGGMMPRQYLKFEDGRSKVRSLVALSPSNHGTTAQGLTTLADSVPGVRPLITAPIGLLCEACTDQLAGSPFITALNEGGDTLPGVRYTVIATRRDEVIAPYGSSFLIGPDVTNITVQDGCALDQAEHLAITYDSRALAYVLNALDPEHPTRVPCRLVLPAVGG